MSSICYFCTYKPIFKPPAFICELSNFKGHIIEMTYARCENESTALWLERLVAIEAPADIRANVQQILVGEQHQGEHTYIQ